MLSFLTLLDSVLHLDTSDTTPDVVLLPIHYSEANSDLKVDHKSFGSFPGLLTNQLLPAFRTCCSKSAGSGGGVNRIIFTLPRCSQSIAARSDRVLVKLAGVLDEFAL